MAHMTRKEILQLMNVGNSVAEFDEALEEYFVETETFRQLITDRADIISGDKGTGKTALYRILRARYPSLPELANVEVIAAFNPAGSPVFQRLAESSVLEEGQYITIWKSYILSLLGNWILGIYEDAYTDRMAELDKLLTKIGLRVDDDKASTIFSRVVNMFRRLTTPESAEVGVTWDASGIPVITPKVTFETGNTAEIETIPHTDALGLLNDVWAESELFGWLVLDRLDEAFQGFPGVEVPALRALLRSYLDIAEFDHVRLKLFLRKDLFRRIIGDGFVNLTHVNARRIEIIWDDEDLAGLLGRRLAEKPEFTSALGLADPSPETVFNTVFPEKVDAGARRPTTWTWIISRIRDGNNVKPPRNLIDLVQKAQDAQLRKEDRDPGGFVSREPLIEGDAMKRGLAALSAARVEDTLLAEAAELAPHIEKFRDGKAEHNLASLGTLLRLDVDQVKAAAKSLIEIGFLEQVGENYKVPMLYRDGLNITQGKAFD